MSRILLISPVRPSLHPELQKALWNNMQATIGSNPEHELGFLIDYTKITSDPTDRTPWSKVTRIRNKILDYIDISAWDHLLWIDADVVIWPANMPTKLLGANPYGVSMPMVLIEGSNRFYDVSACIMRGTEDVEPRNRKRIKGRNVHDEPPYFFSLDGQPYNPINKRESNRSIVEMDCVGTITLVNTDIYRTGVRYEDHPVFTDHYPICKKAREIGRLVTMTTSIKAYHADLPKYGEKWH